jgi:hypothetical protein
MVRVPVTRVVEVVVKVTLIWHVVGAVNVLPTQESPEIANDAVTVSLEKVTDPLPVMLTVTVSAALVAGDVPVGIPNVR